MCPNPSKQSFFSFEEAENRYAEMLANPIFRNANLADWAYRCQCGKWHMTSRHDRYLGARPMLEGR